MPSGYFHGVSHQFIDDVARAVVTQSDESIYLVGDAPTADNEAMPVGETRLIYGDQDTNGIGALGVDGDLPQFVTGMLKKVNCKIFVHRIVQGATVPETIANVIGGIDVDTNTRSGLQAAFDVKQDFGLDPSIFIAPGYSQNLAVAQELSTVSRKLDAVYVTDGPNGTITNAIDYRGNFDDPQGLMVDPHILVTVDGEQVVEPASARVAALVAATPWWESASSRKMVGVQGLAQPIDYRGDGTSRAELLNQNGIATVVRHPDGGWKLLGGRSLSTDPLFTFFKRQRIMNVFARTVVDQYQWAVDRNITRRFFEVITEGMNKWIRHQVDLERIAGGRCWVDADLNTPEAQETGDAYIDYDFADFGEAERIHFRMHLNNGYRVSVVPVAA